MAPGLHEIDVARIYGEKALKQGLAAAPPAVAAAVVFNTKASVRTHRADTVLSYEGVLGQLALSLDEVGRPAANIFYLHQPDARAPLDDALRAVDELHCPRPPGAVKRP
jgi:aryl-alcohol dehydrogenase-like predicted oxidoreductase